MYTCAWVYVRVIKQKKNWFYFLKNCSWQICVRGMVSVKIIKKKRKLLFWLHLLLTHYMYICIYNLVYTGLCIGICGATKININSNYLRSCLFVLHGQKERLRIQRRATMTPNESRNMCMKAFIRTHHKLLGPTMDMCNKIFYAKATTWVTKRKQYFYLYIYIVMYVYKSNISIHQDKVCDDYWVSEENIYIYTYILIHGHAYKKAK